MLIAVYFVVKCMQVKSSLKSTQFEGTYVLLFALLKLKMVALP